jgi:hypothetical protein
MQRRVQPAMQAGGGGPRPWSDDVHDVDDEGSWRDEHRVLTRGWAVTRLIALVVACGLAAAAAIAIFVTAFVTLLDASL